MRDLDAMKKTVVYVGGLDDAVTEDVLMAAFIPFGPVRLVQIPRKDNKARGFGFVEFEEEVDCLAAIENMDGAELFSKTLRCNVAKPNATVNKPGTAVWTTDDFINESELERNEE